MDNLDSRIRVIESKPYDSPGTGRRLWVRLAGPSAAPKPTNGLITGSIYEEVDTGRIYRYDESMQTWHKSIGNGVAPKAGEFWRVSELNGSNLASETIIDFPVPVTTPSIPIPFSTETPEISAGPIWNIGMRRFVFSSRIQIAPASLSSVLTIISRLPDSASSIRSTSSSCSMICHVAFMSLFSCITLPFLL